MPSDVEPETRGTPPDAGLLPFAAGVAEAVKAGPPDAAMLARGATADVLAWSPGRVLNWFRPEVDVHAVRQEHACTREAAALAQRLGSFRVPDVGEPFPHHGRHAMALQRIGGHSLQQRLDGAGPDGLAEGAHRLAVLHAALHRGTVGVQGAWPLALGRLASRIDGVTALTADQRSAALAWLALQRALPVAVCHGDFHPGNVLIDGARRDWLIDWNDACVGPPLLDVARTSWLLLHAGPADVPGWDRATYRPLRASFHQQYLDHYHALHPALEAPARWRDWLPVVAACRLSEGVDDQERFLLLEVVRAM